MTFSKLHLFPPALPSPTFPLTQPLMVIYLVGKGFSFSPEGSTTGHEQKQGSLLMEGGKRKEKGGIYHLDSLPGDTKCALLFFTAVIQVKVWIQEERITCQYLFPLTEWFEKDTLQVLVVFSPLETIPELWLYLESGGTSGVTE